MSSNQGMKVTYFDKDFNEWSSANGAQVGCSFKIVQVKEEIIDFEQYIKIKAELNCILYDDNIANSKKLENGVMIGIWQMTKRILNYKRRNTFNFSNTRIVPSLP